jgi:hypothetical protein
MITHNDIFDNLLDCITKRGTPTILSHYQCELQDFFTDNDSIDATWCILYKADGTTVIKRSGIPGEFVYQTTG